MDAAGTGRFTSTAIKAQVEMVFDIGVERNAAIDDATHEVDAATGGVHLGTELDVSRASGGTQAAMDAVEEEFVIDLLADGRG